MVSKARLDFPDPESPVTTVRLLRGISTEMFFKLWTRAPCTATEVRIAGGLEGPPRRRGEPLASPAGLFAIGKKECELLQRGGAALGRAHGRGRFHDVPLIRQVLTRRRHLDDAVGAGEVAFDFAGRADLARLAEIVEQRLEQRGRP